MAEKMKSVWTSGINSGYPKPIPVPKKPPEAIANKD